MPKVKKQAKTKKYTISLEIKVELELKAGVKLSDAVDELDYDVTAIEEHGCVTNTEMIGYTQIY